MPIVQSDSLRVQVRDTLRRRIIVGDLLPGAPLRESCLSVDLGVSRTPVREALAQLEQEGMVRSQQNCGFTVAPLSLPELEEVFPLMGGLQGLALRCAGVPPQSTLTGLRAMNHVIGANPDIQAVVVEDLHWHRLLLSECHNKRLVAMMGDIENVVHRYDLAFFSEGGNAEISAGQHDEILDALEDGDITLAGRLLEAHWLGGIEWLRGCIERMERGG